MTESVICSRIAAYRLEADRETHEAIQVISTLPSQFASIGDAAEIAVDPEQDRLYVSTRRSNSLRVFEIDRQSGHLRFLADEPSRGSSPSTFAIDPSGTLDARGESSFEEHRSLSTKSRREAGLAPRCPVLFASFVVICNLLDFVSRSIAVTSAA